MAHTADDGPEVRVALAHLLAERIGGADALAVRGATVGAALRDLAARYPALAPWLWREGRFNDQLVVFLNKDDVRRLQGLESPLQAGDTLTVVTALEGGARP